MADCRWINANGGNWNTAANWSTGTVPTAADNVIIDAASFAANGKIITVDVTANCLNFDCSAADQAFTISGSAYSINIYGSLTLSANCTWTFTGTAYVYLKATNAVNITTNNCIMNVNRIHLDGVGGTWTNSDNWNLGAATIHFLNGIWTTNNKSITTTGEIHGSSTTARTLNLGSSVISCFGWVTTNYTTNLVFNCGTSTIILTGSSGFYGGGKLFYNVIFNSGSSAYCGGVNTFNDLTVIGPPNKFNAMQFAGNQTINGILTFSGNNSTNYRLLVSCYTIGTLITLTCNGSIAAQNVDFRDIRGNGISSWDLSMIPGLSGDCQGNSGIIFTPAQSQYFKHASGAVNWSDSTKWFADQAKTIPGRVPLPQDDATFDAGSFTGASTLTVNCYRIGRSLDMSAINQSIVFALSNDVESYGNFIISNSVTLTGIVTTALMGRSYFNFNLSGKTINALYFRCPNGTYTCLGDFTVTLILDLALGTLDLNDFNVTVNYLFQQRGGIWYLGNGLLTANSTAAYSFCFARTSGIIYSEGSTLKCTPSGSNNFTLAFAGIILNKLWLSGSHSGNFDITGSNTIAELIIDPGRKVRFTAGTTQTINKLTAIGTAANPITIGSITNAQHTLALAAGNPEVECDYLNISYSNATPANKFFAGSHSVNSGNNTGWIFADMARFFTWASASGIGSAAATLQLKNILQAIASGTSSAQAALQQLRQMVASAAGVTTANLQLHASRYITAIATGQATADSYAHVLLPIASAAQGTSAASLAMHELIYAVANVVGISVTEATLLVYAYPVEIFEAISKITTLVEARSVITTIITQNSKVF